MKNIVVFGAGKSSTYLIEYLSGILVSHNLNLILVDANEAAALEKLQNSPNTKGIGLDVKNDVERKAQIESADLVISMLPPALHYLVAMDCLEFGKHLLTASYTDSTLTTSGSGDQTKRASFPLRDGFGSRHRPHERNETHSSAAQ